MKKNYLIFGLIILLSASVGAQTEKEITDREQVWFGYFNQMRFSRRWGMWTDLHFRTNNFMSQNFQAFYRGGISYYLKDNMRLMAGYAYIHHFAADGGGVAYPEHRPWQQIWWNQKYNGYTTLQWLRFEQRYNRIVNNGELTQDYRFNYRIRYNFALFIPLTAKELKPKTPFIALQDEIFINFGKEIKYNYFDQNRFFVGLGYQIDTHLNVQLGYMNVFQQRSSGNQFYDTHTLRLFVFQTLDLRKKEASN
jgi:hypothetical protein